MKLETSQSENELQNLSLLEIEFPKILDLLSQRAYSELGKQIILKIIPFSDSKLLRDEIEVVQEIRQILLKGDSIPFGKLNDVYQFIYKSKIENSVLGSTDLIQILDLARTSRNIKSFIRTRQEEVPLLFQNTDLLIENRIFEKHIEESIDESGYVKDTASRELQRIRKEIIEKSAFLRSKLKKLLKKFSDEEYTRDDLISIRDGRFVIPIKVENKRTIPGIIHGASQTGSTVFVEPAEVTELNNELYLLENDEKREIYRILTNLTVEVKHNANELIKSLDILAYFDSQHAKARFSIDFDAVKPKITDENYLFLKDVRHPLLVNSKGIKNVIPLSLELTQDKRGVLISGPNAGGKTVALKTVGLNVAMAISGIFPLGECITNIKTIFSAIGDNQSIQNDLSTFSAQMLRLKLIIENAYPESLILIDEIGSGTDPVEGSAIASGILETFSEMKVLFLTTTHQSSLKTFALNRAEIENASLEFDEKMLKPTYKFLMGMPGNSYAFSLARNIGISQLVLSRSQKYLDSKQHELEKGIKLINKLKRKSLNALSEANKERIKSQTISSEYEIKFAEFKKKKNELMVEARKEAQKVLESANSLIERTIKEIREEQKQISLIKKEYEEKKKELTIPTEKENLEQKEIEFIDTRTKKQEDKKSSVKKSKKVIETGSIVKYSENPNTGKVLELDKEKKLALVDFNGIKFKIKLTLLELSEEEIIPENYSRSAFTENLKLDAKTRLDLRGERVDTALRKVDEFVSDAILSNVTLVSIIHGKGTGALREAIQNFLRHHQSVKSFRDGDLVEGGAGVTIVEF